MALTESNNFENGTLAPEFSLRDVVTGKTMNLSIFPTNTYQIIRIIKK